jgi:MFS family permease
VSFEEMESRSERSGSKRRGAIVALLFLGLLLGGIVGGWIGGITGGHKADVAEAAGELCYFECSYVFDYAFVGVLLEAGAIFAGLVVAVLSRKPTTPPSASGRLQP